MEKLEFVCSKRNKKVLVYNNYTYHKHYVSGTIAHFKCTSQYLGCSSRIKVFGYDEEGESCVALRVNDKSHDHSPSAIPKHKKVTNKSVEWAKGVQRTKQTSVNVNTLSPCPVPDEIDLNVVVIKQESPDLNESEDNNDIRIIENSENTEPCLVCGQMENSRRARQRLKNFSGLNKGREAKVVKPHLWSIYVLRKLLQLPQQECVNLFSKTSGVSNPADWFILCGLCCQLGQTAYKLECRIHRSEKRLLNIKTELVSKLHQSLIEEDDRDTTSTVFDTRHNLRSYFKGSTSIVLASKRWSERCSKKQNDTFSPPSSPEPNYNIDDYSSHSPGDNSDALVSEKIHHIPSIKCEDVIPSSPSTSKNRKVESTKSGNATGVRGPYAKQKIFAKTKTGYKCLVCPFTTVKDGQLWHHIKLHRQGKQCDLCKRPALNEKMLYLHMERSHPGLHTMKPPNKKSYKVKSTQEIQKDPATNKDVSDSPRTSSVATTNNCNENTNGSSSDSSDADFVPSPSRVPSRARVKKLNKPTPEKCYGPRGPYAKEKPFSVTKNGFQCLLCPFTTARDGQLRHHIRLHRQGKQCHICNRPALNDQMLYCHLERCHPGAHSMEPPPDLQKYLKYTKPKSKSDSKPELCIKSLITPKNPTMTNDKRDSVDGGNKKLKPTKTGKRYGPRGPNGPKLVDKTDTGFKCRVCPFLTSREPQMNYHVKLHRIGKHCELCNHPAFNEMKLYLHMEKTHKDAHKMERPLLQCDKCTFKCKYLYEMESHMRNYHGRLESVNVDLEKGIYSCKLCPQVFDSELTVLRHIGRDHKVELGLNTHQCHLCEKSFVESNILQNHIRMYHDQDRKFICTVCGFGFKRGIDLWKHSRTHTANEERVTYICDSCGLSFQTEGGLRRHKKSIHFLGVPASIVKQELESTQGSGLTPTQRGHEGGGKRRWNKCSQCGLVCVNFRAAKLHVKETHPELFLFQCDLCDSKYTTARSLLHHKQRVHQPEEKGTCEKCGNEVPYSILQAHRKKCKHTING